MRRFALLLAASLAGLFAGPAAAQEQDLLAALCDQRTPCEIVARTPASQDTATRPVEVVEISLGPEHPEGGFECRPYLREFWVVIGGTPRQRLLRLCNDGYGAAGLGEDEVRVFRNRLVHLQSGGSAWRWSVLTRYRVAPAMRLREEHCSFHNIATGFQITDWNWQDFTGLVRMRFQDEGEPADGNVLGCQPQNTTHRYLPVPRIDAIEGLEEGGVAPLGSCAVSVHENGSSGFRIHGPPAKDGGAEMRLLLIGARDLLVTVIDPDIRSDGESWVHDDHIEIWQAGLMSIGPEYLESDPLQQWGVRLSDGAVFKGAGHPEEQPEILGRVAGEVEGMPAVTLRLRLVRDAHSLTVVYSNSRDGRQYRMIANSPLRFGEARTLGGVFRVTDGAHCGVHRGMAMLSRSGLLRPVTE